MQFESLANELLLDIFEYINVIHLFRAFRGLNARFDRLLLIHFHAYDVDFQSVSKPDFDLFCGEHLSLMIERVVSVRLSNDDDTPDLPDHFLRYHFTISRFTRLQFLKLHAFDSTVLLLKLVSDCRRLPSLTHLKITECSFSSNDHLHDLINNIWGLPKLTHCHLDSSFLSTTYLTTPILISSSIEYLFMKSIRFVSKSLIEVLNHTPHLRYFCTTLRYEHEFPQPFIVAPLILRLKMSINYPLSLLGSLFQMMPNLRHVTLEIPKTSDATYLSGHRWKQVISDHLPSIKVFRFFVRFHFSNQTNIEEKIDQALDTFRTSFWLNEHRWFVQCEWNPQIINQTISLYTLPHCLGDVYALYPTIRFKSTCPKGQNDNDVCHSISSNDALNWHLSFVLFPKLGHLRVRLPTHGNVWSFICTLDYLTSLHMSVDNKTDLSQLQVLIDGAPRLCSLYVNKASASQLSQLNIIHAQLRRVSLTDYCFNAPECSLLASSPLGRQCEFLSIAVTDRRNVPGLINEMSSLRALTCFCEDNKWDLDESLSSAKDDVVKWLQDRLPSRCSISCRMRNQSDIRVWFG